MPFKMSKTKTMPVGIDLGTAVVKMAQMRDDDGHLELFAAAQVDVPSDCRGDSAKRRDFMARSMRALLKDNGFKGRQCAISVPAVDTFVQHVKIAMMSPDEIDKALRWELESKLPFNSSDAIIRHITVGNVQNEKEGEQEVIAIAISRQSAEAYLKMAGAGKMEVVALNVEPCAILECFTRLLGQADDANEATLFLDLGEAYTQVVIAYGSELVFARNLLFGSDCVNGVVSEVMGMSVEEVKSIRRKVSASEDSVSAEADQLYEAMSRPLTDVVDEITKCLRYYESIFPSNPVERAIFLGGQARDRRLCQDIARRLNLPSRIGDPLAGTKRTESAGIVFENESDQTQPEWAVAVGLSLGAKPEPRAA